MKNLLDKIFPKEYDIPNMLASQGCTHTWQLFAKNYAPPRPGIELDGLSEALAQKVLLGVTTYLWECKICSQIRKEETLGSDESQLEDILEKASKFGIQYIEQEGIIFAVAKVPADESKIPLR